MNEQLGIEDVRPVVGSMSEETVGYYVPGHLDKHAVADVVFRTAIEDGFEEADAKNFPAPVHEMWRNVPAPKDSPCYMIFQRQASGPGAFPVTHVEIEKW